MQPASGKTLPTKLQVGYGKLVLPEIGSGMARLSAPKLLIPLLFLVAAHMFSASEGHTSKFTHPQRAYVTLSDVKVIRSPAAAKKALPRKSQYQWGEPSVDGSNTCAFSGKVLTVKQVVDAWQLVDLSKTFVGAPALVTGPCSMKIDKGLLEAEISFSPKYDPKRKGIFGTVASGKVVRSETLLRLGPDEDIDYNGYRFCLRNVQAMVDGEGSNSKPSVSSFEVRWFRQPATKDSKVSTLFFNVYGKPMASQPYRHGLFQESGPFSAFLQDFQTDGATLEHAEIQVFQK
jgi:hypothetical protein